MHHVGFIINVHICLCRSLFLTLYVSSAWGPIWFKLTSVKLASSRLVLVKWRTNQITGTLKTNPKQQSSLTCSWDARQSILTPNFDGFGGIYPLHVFGYCADPKKALPCVIARNLSHCAWKSVHGHFSRRVREKINQDKKDKALYFTYLSRRSLRVDWHKFWVTFSSRGRQLCNVLS